jgi:hypothetical protein
MTNLLEQAISVDDADRAAQIIQDALGIESDEVANYRFPRHGRRIASGAPRSSANGYRQKRVFWLDDGPQFRSPKTATETTS